MTRVAGTPTAAAPPHIVGEKNTPVDILNNVYHTNTRVEVEMLSILRGVCYIIPRLHKYLITPTLRKRWGGGHNDPRKGCGSEALKLTSRVCSLYTYVWR